MCIQFVLLRNANVVRHSPDVVTPEQQWELFELTTVALRFSLLYPIIDFVLGSIPGLATYFRFSFRFFKKGSCQLLAKVCARNIG